MRVKKLWRLVTAIIAAVMLCAECSAYAAGNSSVSKDLLPVHAAALPASGTWGTCSWTIDEDGVLTIGAGTGSSISGTSPWSTYASQITKVKESGTVVLPADSHSLFYGFSKLTDFDSSSLNTMSVTNMNSMFANCTALNELDLSHFNTGKVTTMQSMFRNCQSLASLKFGEFNTSNVTNMSWMFGECRKLKSLDLSDFDTEKVKDLSCMFMNDAELTSLNVSSFNTDNVTNMLETFYGCSSLTELNLSTFNTEKVTDMYGLFQNCSKLASLDISQFDLTHSPRVSGMFLRCPVLSHIVLGPKSLISSAGLYSPSKTSPYTGKWAKVSAYNHAEALTASELNAKYSASGSPESAVWVWEKEGSAPYSQYYESDNGVEYNDDGTKKTDSSGSLIHNLLDPLKDAIEQIKAFISPKTKGTTGYWTKVNDDTWTYTFYVNNSNVSWHYWEKDVPEGYTSDHTESNPGIILKSSSSKEGDITNTPEAKPEYGSLKISKIMADSDRTFSFKVTLTNADGTALTGTAVYGNTAFLDGSADVAVKAGEFITMTDIPAGYKYHVEETNLPDGYQAPVYVNQDGTIAKDTVSNVTCTNSRVPDTDTSTGTLTVTKSAPGSDDEYTMHVIFDGLKTDTKYTYNDGNSHEFTADDKGHAEIKLTVKDGSSIAFADLPASTMYKVSEDETGAIASYEITGSDTAVIMNASDKNGEINTPLSTAQEQMKGTDGKAANITVAFTNTLPEYSVSVTKRDDAENFVAGAVLQIKSGDKVVHEWTTVEGGQETISLKSGKYVLHEASAPKGYASADDIPFKVTAAGKIIKTVNGVDETVHNIAMIDDRAVPVYIEKKDDQYTAVSGAEMALYEDGKDDPVETWTTDGKSHLLEVKYGKSYTLKEMKVPDGYAKADDTAIAVDASGKMKVNGKSAGAESTITVIDAKRRNAWLPSAGGSGTMFITITAVIGMVLFVWVRKKSEKAGDAE